MSKDILVSRRIRVNFQVALPKLTSPSYVAVAEQLTFLKSYILIALNIKYLQFKKIILFPCHKDLLKFVCFIFLRAHAHQRPDVQLSLVRFLCFCALS